MYGIISYMYGIRSVLGVLVCMYVCKVQLRGIEIAQPFKAVQFQAWKIAPSSSSLKTKNCFEPP